MNTPQVVVAVLISLVLWGVIIFVIFQINNDTTPNIEQSESGDDKEEYTPDEKPIGNMNGGDPAAINQAHIITRPVFPDQYMAKHDGFDDLKFYFDLDCDGKPEWVDRNPTGTTILFQDLNGDGIPSNGCEIFYSPHMEFWEILRDFDNNKDGLIDSKDKRWSIMAVSDFITHKPITESGIGFIAIGTDENNMGWVKAEPDYVGNGRYSDCIYVEDHAYDQAVLDGFTCDPISQDHFRYTSWNEKALYHETHGWVEMYSLVLGHWECTNGNDVETGCKV